MKKRICITAVLAALVMMFTTCDEAESILGSNSNESQALIQALLVSADSAVVRTNVTNGYFANKYVPEIKINMPSEITTVTSLLNYIGGKELVNSVVKKMNEAAEDAAAEALPILKNAINGITITDAVGILTGGQDAATNYLISKTESSLISAFAPKIDHSMDQVGLPTVWNQFTTNYNSAARNSYAQLAAQVAGVTLEPVSTDLGEYVTGKAIDGLEKMMKYQELQIRTDVNARVTDLLKDVFGKYANK